MSIDHLNADVTAAILRAEDGDHALARLWDDVARAEQALVDALEDGLEREIARRGVETAKARAEALRGHRA